MVIQPSSAAMRGRARREPDESAGESTPTPPLDLFAQNLIKTRVSGGPAVRDLDDDLDYDSRSWMRDTEKPRMAGAFSCFYYNETAGGIGRG
jgi:hypothetical protein